MRKSTKRNLSIAAITVVLIGAGGAAFAYWTAGGSGTGTAATGNNLNLTVNQVSVITDLKPGGAAQALSGTFNNPNTAATYVGSVTVSISSVTKAGGAVAGVCDATDYVIVDPAAVVNAEIPVGNSQGAWSGPTIQFFNKTTNQDQCKGATVNLAYAIS